MSRPIASARELLERLALLAPSARDAACEQLLGLGPLPPDTPPGEQLIGYHASGVASILHMLLEVPITPNDLFVDLGAGLGKVTLLVSLLTGARVRGIELQPELVERARAAIVALGADVELVQGDARSAPLDDGTVFFMYRPFSGPALQAVLTRLRAVAQRQTIVVCTLGLDLAREAPWLTRRPLDAFWLDIYDSALPGAVPRPSAERSPLWASQAETIAFERAR